MSEQKLLSQVMVAYDYVIEQSMIDSNSCNTECAKKERYKYIANNIEASRKNFPVLFQALTSYKASSRANVDIAILKGELECASKSGVCDSSESSLVDELMQSYDNISHDIRQCYAGWWQEKIVVVKRQKKLSNLVIPSLIFSLVSFFVALPGYVPFALVSSSVAIVFLMACDAYTKKRLELKIEKSWKGINQLITERSLKIERRSYTITSDDAVYIHVKSSNVISQAMGFSGN